MHALLKDIETLPTLTRFGRVARLEGLGVEARRFPAKWWVFATAGPW
jgi:hypothetical protein